MMDIDEVLGKKNKSEDEDDEDERNFANKAIDKILGKK